MNISREAKKLEAIKRMKALDIMPEVIAEFEKKDIVEVSEPPFGALYYLDEKQEEILHWVESQFNCLVYLVVKCYTEIGMMDSFLIVSDYKEDWVMDWESLDADIVFTYTHNYDAPECSEFGSIAIKKMFGGVIRIG